MKPKRVIVINADRWAEVIVGLLLLVAVYAWAGEADLADQSPRAEARK